MQASIEDEVLRGLDGPQLALELHHHLTPDLRRVAALRASGAELKAIAGDQQVAVSTAHQRVARAGSGSAGTPAGAASARTRSGGCSPPSTSS